MSTFTVGALTRVATLDGADEYFPEISLASSKPGHLTPRDRAPLMLAVPLSNVVKSYLVFYRSESLSLSPSIKRQCAKLASYWIFPTG